MSEPIQRMVDAAPNIQNYVFSGKHSYNIRNKNDTFTVDGVDADLRRYIPTLARRGRCFPRKLENLRAVVAVFVLAYNRFGIQKNAIVPDIQIAPFLFLFMIFFNNVIVRSPKLNRIDESRKK